MNFFQKKYRISFLALFLISFFNQVTNAQFTLSGRILDSTTGAALPFANVYIANTTIGVDSGEDGSFILENVPSGNQEMIISFLGYKVYIKKINVNKFSAERSITIKLTPLAIDLAEVEVKAMGKKKRKRFLKKFERAFLGKTFNAKKSKILNPQVIDFQQDGRKIIATAQDFIEVENRSTGYLIKFYLEKFEMQGSNVTYGGKPIFEQLPSDSEEEKVDWFNNKMRTYQGSSRHFYEALVRNDLKKEGFRISLVQQKNTREFHNERPVKAKNILKESNSAQYQYVKIDEFLKVIFVKKKKHIKRDLGSGIGQLGQTAERDLIQQTQKDLGDLTSYPTSYLFPRKTAMKISKEGRLFEPELMLLYGDWANEGVADLLPFDFKMETVELEEVFPEQKSTTQNILRRKGFFVEELLVPIEEIKDGGPGKDGIPSIDNPNFINTDENNFLTSRDEILGVNFNGVVKAYPIKIMNRHEIVNDYFGDVPVAITFCPLCGSGVGVKAMGEKQRLSFGVSGLLYNSDVLLYDRETESLWSQILGQAINGEASGQKLKFVPVELTSWGEWKKRFPNSLILSTQTGFDFDYEKKVYQKYFETEQLMFPVKHQSEYFNNKDKIIGIEVDGKFKAYSLKKLKRKKLPIQDTFNGKQLMIYFDKKSNAARIENEDGVVLNGMTMFWFAWYTFHPKTEIF